ncbi:hypothetical protein PJP10_30715 [Mycobacterium kansasii]
MKESLELTKEAVAAEAALKDTLLIKLLKDKVIIAVADTCFDERRILSSLAKHPLNTIWLGAVKPFIRTPAVKHSV